MGAVQHDSRKRALTARDQISLPPLHGGKVASFMGAHMIACDGACGLVCACVRGATCK